MKEQINSSYSRETGTPLHDDARIDMHVANPNLLTLQEVENRRRQQAFDEEARRLMDAARAPERVAVSPYEHLSTIGATLIRIRRETRTQDDFDRAA
ncbi:MAG TPA: hypothetical protein VIQ80_02170 [Candidatus Saccharimonadales bacterium]